MPSLIIKCLFLVLLVVLLSSAAMAGVDKHSIFLDARTAASELDLELLRIQMNWWRAFVWSPDADTRKKYPLITRVGLGIDLHYYGDDLISATGWVMKLDGFLSLSVEERKNLVKDTFKQLSDYLLFTRIVDKDTGEIKGLLLENRHIMLSIIINEVMENEKKESIRLLLPQSIGAGQAGYKEGKYIYSEPYFLNLKVRAGHAVPGDSTKFVIEGEN